MDFNLTNTHILSPRVTHATLSHFQVVYNKASVLKIIVATHNIEVLRLHLNPLILVPALSYYLHHNVSRTRCLTCSDG